MANTIKIGNIEASAIKIGTSNVSAVYIGSTKIYPSGTPTPPTDNWVLINDTFDNPRKIKVDYSLIDDDVTEIRSDYELGFPSEAYLVVYVNTSTIGWARDEFDLDLGEFTDMVAVISASGELKEILEDGVEYSEIGGTSITEMDEILIYPMGQNNPYLYATE